MTTWSLPQKPARHAEPLDERYADLRPPGLIYWPLWEGAGTPEPYECGRPLTVPNGAFASAPSTLAWGASQAGLGLDLQAGHYFRYDQTPGLRDALMRGVAPYSYNRLSALCVYTPHDGQIFERRGLYQIHESRDHNLNVPGNEPPILRQEFAVGNFFNFAGELAAGEQKIVAFHNRAPAPNVYMGGQNGEIQAESGGSTWSEDSNHSHFFGYQVGKTRYGPRGVISFLAIDCTGAYSMRQLVRWMEDPYAMLRPAPVLAPAALGGVTGEPDTRPATSAALRARAATSGDPEARPAVTGTPRVRIEP